MCLFACHCSHLEKLMMYIQSPNSGQPMSHYNFCTTKLSIYFFLDHYIFIAFLNSLML